MAIANQRTRANDQLTLSNFEMDLDSSSVCLRASLAVPNQTLALTALQQRLLHNRQIADRHLPGFLAVLAGERAPFAAIGL